MEKKLAQDDFFCFSKSHELFQSLSTDSVVKLAALGADIALLITPEGVITDVAYKNHQTEDYGIANWIGANWQDTVTVESVEKINALIDEAVSNKSTRRRQVNHSANGKPDLPVEYTVMSFDELPVKVALGYDLSKLIGIQEKLVHTQVELEREYRKIRDAETRYRTIFQKASEAMLLVSGDDGKIVDANAAASRLLDTTTSKLIDASLANVISNADGRELSRAMADAKSSGTNQVVEIDGHTENGLTHLIVEPFREHGKSNFIVSFQFAGQQASLKSQVSSGMEMLGNCPESLVLVDSKGLITASNEQFLDATQIVNESKMIGKSLDNWLGASAVDLQVLLSRVHEEGQVRQFSTTLRDELGGDTPVAVSAKAIGAGASDSIAVLIAKSSRRDGQVAIQANGMGGSADFAELIGRVPLKELIRESSDVIEKMCIEAALRQTNNNRASAADLLGLSRQSLYNKLNRFEIENPKPSDDK